MGKAFWIQIGLAILGKWLEKQDSEQPLVKDLIAAKDVKDIKNIVKKDSTAKTVEAVVTEAAQEPVGGLLDILFGWMFK